MTELTICEHASSSYSPRTYYNAQLGDITIAFAVNFATAGEKLTKKAAGEKYLAIPLDEDVFVAAADILEKCYTINPKIINIAGNGIYTLNEHSWTQEAINRYIYEVLKIVHEHSPIEKIISGGQTGVDIAGIVAAYALGIPAQAMLPNGFVQRKQDKKDYTNTMESITEYVHLYAELLTC